MPPCAAMQDETPTKDRYVFVYGTLRRGQANDITRLRPVPRWVGEGRVRGTLYHLGAYPGIVLGHAGWVQGEVYAIPEALEPVLDAIEEMDPPEAAEYTRQMVAVETARGTAMCLVYALKPHLVPGLGAIEGGDWCARG